MGMFAIDKVANAVGNVVQSSIFSEFTFQAPQVPENRKSRMTFRNLYTVNGEKLPDVELYIDPNSITVNKSVIANKKLTKGGFAVQFWGHDLTTINVNCVTGNFQPLYGIGVQIPPSLSGAAFTSWFNQVRERWVKGGGPLKVFEKLKEWGYHQRYSTNEPWKGKPVIEVFWEDSLYEGFFTKFNYTLGSESPFNISFNFDFTILNRRDMSFEDLIGTLSIKKLIGDPLGTLQEKVKQTTALVVSKAAKEVSKLASEIPLVGDFISKEIVDTLPNKITLW